MKSQLFQIIGMDVDTSPSKIKNDKAVNIKNMRITAQENSQFVSLTSEKGNTEIPIVDESALQTTISIPGEVKGYCTLGDYVVLFICHTESTVTNNYDCIWRLEWVDNTKTTFKCRELYRGNLGFSSLPSGIQIDTHVLYENENVQKVYWIDGVHQPRFINIAADSDTRALWAERDNPFDFVPPLKYNEDVIIEKTHYAGLFPAGTLQYVMTYFNRWGQQSSAFYKSPIYYTSPYDRGGSPEETVSNAFHIKVTNFDDNFDYLRLYSIVRASEKGTPICRLVGDYTPSIIDTTDCVKVPEDGDLITRLDIFHPVKEGFRIFKVTDADRSVGREVSLDTIPYEDLGGGIKRYTFEQPYTTNGEYYILIAEEFETEAIICPERVEFTMTDNEADSYYTLESDGALKYYIYGNVQISEDSLYGIDIIDNNTLGSYVDYSEIEYADGVNIIPQTFEEKEGTLFFGNYKYTQDPLDETFINTVKQSGGVYIRFKYALEEVSKGSVGGAYYYSNQLNSSSDKITGFKGGETYSFGIMFQDGTGQWSSVIDLGNYTNNLYPLDTNKGFYPVKVVAYLSDDVINAAKAKGFVRSKLVVNSSILNHVICQGVLSPTVFDLKRKSSVYAQPSWFFRGLYDNTNDVAIDSHYANIPDLVTAVTTGTEVSNVETIDNIDGIWSYSAEVMGASKKLKRAFDGDSQYNPLDMYVDWNILTLNSPDIEFEEVTDLTEDTKMRIIGVIPVSASTANMYLTTSTSPMSKSSDTESVRIFKNQLFTNRYIYNIDLNAISKTLATFSWKDVCFNTSLIYTNQTDGWVYYPIYPWHCDTPLTYQTLVRKSDGDNQYHYEVDTDTNYGRLETKVLANEKFSPYTQYLDEGSVDCYIYDSCIVQDDGVNKVLKYNNADEYYPLSKTYLGSVDYTLIGEHDQLILPYISCMPNTGTPRLFNWSGTATYPHEVHPSINMRYKCAPHATLDLGWTNNKQNIMPYLMDVKDVGGLPASVMYGQFPDNAYGIPFWDNNLPDDFDPDHYKQLDAVVHTASDGTTLIDGTQIIIDGVTQFSVALTESESPQYCTYSGVVLKSLVLNNLRTDTEIKAGMVIDFPHLSLNIPSISENKHLLFYVYNVGAEYVSIYSYPNAYNFMMWNRTTLETAVPISTGVYAHIGKYLFGYYTDNVSADLGKCIHNWYDAVEHRFLHLTDEVPKDTFTFSTTFPNPVGIRHYGDIGTTFCWTDEEFTLPKIEVNQSSVDIRELMDTHYNGYFYLAELYRDNITLPRGEDIQYTDCSQPTRLTVPIQGVYGDTFYQRYDCLKTYPYSSEDQNQIVEILSFMCETRVNIDGRWDKLRAAKDNSIVTGTNFNLINKAYTQSNDMRYYAFLDPLYYDLNNFNNQIVWTKTKQYNEKIDSWSNIIGTSILSLQGDKGKITKLLNWNNTLLCFQDRAVSRILYNERIGLTSTDGVPLELANSGKVDGYEYLSTVIGCSHKRSIYPSNIGVYFSDAESREIYAYNGQFTSLSKTKLFNTYFYDMNYDNLHLDYDNILKSVYFVDNNNCLCYDENLGTFSSFFSYENSDMFNFKNDFLAIHDVSNVPKLWKQFGGDYNTYFGEWKGYELSFIANENPLVDKTFTDLEYRADSYTQPQQQTGAEELAHMDTFDEIVAENEYQRGSSDLNLHSNLEKKFRIWRVLIPRVTGTIQRIRNTWTKITLRKKKSNTAGNGKTTLHDIIVKYI